MNVLGKFKRLIIIYIVAGLFRVWLGSLLGVWFPGEQGADDALMILYSAFPNYFGHMTHDWVMLKELGMPVFLQVVNLSGISYPIAISLLWIIDGLLLSVIARRISHSDVCGLVAYLLALFVPASFDVFCGTRLYRAGLLNPMYVMTFSLFLILLLDAERLRPVKRTLLAILTGLVLSFTCFIKEDGIWVLAVACALAFCQLMALFARRDRTAGAKVLIRACVTILVPFLILGAATLCYKGINYHFFGVFETNARTGGESGEFVENIYRIASEDRTNVVWAPKDAIEKAFLASPTLSAHPELKEAIYTSWWLEYDIDQNPIQGDFLTWILKDAVFECGLVTNMEEKEAFFRQVNLELKEAFRQGTLAREKDRTSILSSMGPKTGEEIGQAMKDAFRVMGYHIFLYDYEPGGRIVSGEVADICMPASIIANYYLVPLNDSASIAAREIEIKIAHIPVRIIFALGKILIPLLLVASWVGIVMTIVRFFKNRFAKELWLSFVTALAGLGLTFVAYLYSFMVTLFCTEFPTRNVLAEKMYSVGVVSLLLLVIVIGISLLTDRIMGRSHRE